MLAQFFLSLSAEKQARLVLSTTICSIFMERSEPQPMLLSPFQFLIKKETIWQTMSLSSNCFIKRDHWPIEWTDLYCPGFITLWIQIQDTVTVSQHTTWIPHARFPKSNRNMFTMALDHQVQVFQKLNLEQVVVRNLHLCGIRCFHIHVHGPSAKPRRTHRPQTCLKETWYVK